MMSSYYGALAVAAALILCVVVPARADDVDDYVERHLRQLHIPGLSLAVLRNGRVIKARGYGLANVEQNVPATEETVYEIGSVSKQFAATAIMMLVEEGRVGLDDPLTKYFPEAPQKWSRITIRHLLTHSSGLFNYIEGLDFVKLGQTEFKRDEILKTFYRLAVEFAPGETWAYSNTGYYLLGFIVERESGKTYWEFLDERIFKPLGMASTRNTDPRTLIPHRATGYVWLNGTFEGRAPLSVTAAYSAGALVSTVGDLARWDAALYTERLLKRSSLEQMWTPARAKGGAPAPFDYGFGWFVDAYRERRVLLHSGGTPGFSSAVYRFPDDRVSVIILTNHADRVVEQLAVDVAGIYHPALARQRGNSDPEPKRSLALKEAMAGLLKGKPDSALFTPAMRAFLDTTAGRGLWQWIASHGEMKSFDFSEQENAGKDSIFRYQVALGDNRFWFSFRIAEDGRVVQVRLW